VDLLRVAIAPVTPAVTAISSLTAILAAEAAAAGAPHTELEGEPVAEAITAAEATQTATSPVSRAAATIPVAELRKFGTTNPQARMTASPSFSAQLRNLLLSEKFKPLGITKYDAKQDPVQWLRCYGFSIENAGGNNDTKCLYFLFCLDQAPLT
jgi:hypothetical protein